eukprot:s527_g23.t1
MSSDMFEGQICMTRLTNGIGAVQHALHAEDLWGRADPAKQMEDDEEVEEEEDQPSVPSPAAASLPPSTPAAAPVVPLMRARGKRPAAELAVKPGAPPAADPAPPAAASAPRSLLKRRPSAASDSTEPIAGAGPEPHQPGLQLSDRVADHLTLGRNKPVSAPWQRPSCALRVNGASSGFMARWRPPRRGGRRVNGLSSVQMMCRALLLIAAGLSTTLAAKLAAAPNIQQERGRCCWPDGIVNLLASSQPTPGTPASKNKASEMEQMVLLLAQQAKVARKSSQKADGNLEEFVEMIKKELGKMESKIKDADTFGNLSAGCPVYSSNTSFMPAGFDGDFTPLREAHSSCRSQISSRKQEMDSCKSSRESLILQEHTLTAQFRSINVFESPEECAVTGTDVLGYLASMRDHFDGKKTTWWSTYYKLENVTQNITKWNCTEKELAYYNKLTECSEKQLTLEETACELHARTKEACAMLPSCFDKNWEGYSKQVALANGTIQDA